MNEKEIIQAENGEFTPPKRKRPERSLNEDPATQPGTNRAYLEHSLEIYRLPPLDTNDHVAVRNRIIEYFEVCAKNDMKPSVAGLALSLGVDRRTFNTWINGRTHKPAEVVDALKSAYLVLNAQMEDNMQNGKINPVAGIFLMKNNMGYRDQTEYVVSPQPAIGDGMTPEQIAEKYQDLIEE